MLPEPSLWKVLSWQTDDLSVMAKYARDTHKPNPYSRRHGTSKLQFVLAPMRPFGDCFASAAMAVSGKLPSFYLKQVALTLVNKPLRTNVQFDIEVA